jgi:hypothetical protein
MGGIAVCPNKPCGCLGLGCTTCGNDGTASKTVDITFANVANGTYCAGHGGHCNTLFNTTFILPWLANNPAQRSCTFHTSAGPIAPCTAYLITVDIIYFLLQSDGASFPACTAPTSDNQTVIIITVDSVDPSNVDVLHACFVAKIAGQIDCNSFNNVNIPLNMACDPSPASGEPFPSTTYCDFSSATCLMSIV